jgi:hypothetical protein
MFPGLNFSLFFVCKYFKYVKVLMDLSDDCNSKLVNKRFEIVSNPKTWFQLGEMFKKTNPTPNIPKRYIILDLCGLRHHTIFPRPKFAKI